MKQINSFNEIRALSAITVVFSHIGCTNKLLHGNPGGFAVCVFFLLSGFLTVYSTEKKDNSFFLLKRLAKIVPLYYAMTVVCFVSALLKPSWFNTAEPKPINLIKSLLFIPYINSNGLSRPLLDVGWYLNVLVLYYVVFRISMLIVYKYRVHISSVVLIAIAMAGEIFCSNNAVFIIYRNGLIMLPVGMFVALAMSKYGNIDSNSAIKQRKPSFLVNVVLYFVYIITMLLFSYLQIPAYVKLILPTVVFIMALILNSMMITTKLMFFISEVSMSVYLTHEFVVKGISRLVYNLDNISVASLLISVVCVIIAVVIAVPVNIIFEKKISRCLINVLRKAGGK